MIPPQILAIGGGVLLVTGFLGGWTVNGWKYEAAAKEAAEALIEAKDEKAAIVARHAGDFEAYRQEVDQRRTASVKTIREVYRDVPVPADCALRPDALGVLEDARQRANAATTGQSGEPVPDGAADLRDRP